MEGVKWKQSYETCLVTDRQHSKGRCRYDETGRGPELEQDRTSVAPQDAPQHVRKHSRLCLACHVSDVGRSRAERTLHKSERTPKRASLLDIRTRMYDYGVVRLVRKVTEAGKPSKILENPRAGPRGHRCGPDRQPAS
jgi:hypothetical protein